ncbi:MAG TPA: fused MFS/spermidine synthase [Vicinamibacteria bacterium]|nr:fused MFS/spermidine synthase [Vicinamibacteria bacterium]
MSAHALAGGSAPAPARAGAAPLVLAAAAFLVSGASGLVYQVAWQRILALMSGVGIYSIAMIVAAFMAGLGAGSHLGGRHSLRLTPRRALLTFALVELGIGAFGAASCWLYYDVLHRRAPFLYASPWTAGPMHFLTLAIPTFLMGTSLPFLTRALVGEARTAGRTIGVLYGINLLGAAAGALLTPWLLIRNYGVRGAVWWAAAGNVTAGVIAIALFAYFRRRGTDPDPAPVTEASGGGETQRFALWMGLYALSGFCALSLEILWFRLLEVAVKANAFTFGTMLALYLLGSAVGCLLGAPFVARLRRPLRTFLLCQCLLLAYSGAAVVLLAYGPLDRFPLQWYADYWRQTGGFSLGLHTVDSQALTRLYVWLPFALFGPPTVLMGFAFPVLQRAVHDDPRTSGHKVGLLQAANIFGCVAGSLAVGLLALAWLGTSGTLRLLMAAGACFAVVGLRRFGARTAFSPLLAGLVVLAFVIPGQRRLWLRIHGNEAASALVEEDATGVSAILPTANPPWRVFVGGKSHSWLPFGGIHSSLGATPAVVHPAPVDVAIIGLGSADTAWAAGCREETRSVTVFEISGPQPRLLRRLGAREELPDLRRFLADPRVRIVVADGRNALAREDRRYDLIEADALWPDVSYAGNLYSAEFFEQCARRLKPGGVVCTWAPTPRVYAAFTRTLRHVVGRPDVLIGSNDPIPFDPEAWHARLTSPAVSAYLGGRAVTDAEQLLKQLHPRNLKGRVHPARQTNFDLFPRDEFQTPK